MNRVQASLGVLILALGVVLLVTVGCTGRVCSGFESPAEASADHAEPVESRD